MMDEFVGTRDAGLARLEAFVPRMGTLYARDRNHDRGPGRHHSVSGLSPWLRRRLVTEPEVIGAALAVHGAEAAEKFIQEVVWRSYFKGWLERRPQVWTSYRQGLASDLAKLDQDKHLRRAFETAVVGETGLECFDAWVRELTETGYLHNHARMWFASIWIFTLRLPWRLGADFFFRHLIDGDAASNTLGWRWVAGLHTRGKPYAAQAWNIAKFTGERFMPRESDLVVVTEGLEAEEPDGLPPLQPLREVAPPRPDLATALLITDEDCLIEDFDWRRLQVRTTATLATSHLRSPLTVAPSVGRFEVEALADAAARLGLTTNTLRADKPDNLVAWASAAGVRQIVTPYVTCGPLADWLSRAAPSLAAEGINLSEWRRTWDGTVWPHATAGFFKVKERIPAFLARLPVVEAATG